MCPCRPNEGDGDGHDESKEARRRNAYIMMLSVVVAVER